MGLYKDYGNNLSGLIDCIMRSFAESDVPAELHPRFDGSINQTPRAVIRRTLGRKSNKYTYCNIHDSFMTKSEDVTMNKGIMVNEFLLNHPLFLSDQSYHFCDKAHHVLQELISFIGVEEEYPTVYDVVNDCSKTSPGLALVDGKECEQQEIKEGTLKRIRLRCKVPDGGKQMKDIIDGYVDKNVHVVLQNVLRRDIVFGDIFQPTTNSLLTIKTFHKSLCDTEVVPDSGIIFMKTDVFMRYLLNNKLITLRDYKRATTLGIFGPQDENDDSIHVHNGNYEYQTSSASETDDLEQKILVS